MVGGSIGVALFSLERFVLRCNAGGLFRRLPFLPYLALRSLLYAGVIFVINAVVDLPMSGQFMVVGSIDFLFSLALVVVGKRARGRARLEVLASDRVDLRRLGGTAGAALHPDLATDEAFLILRTSVTMPNVP